MTRPSDISDIIEGAVNCRWSGEIRINLSFGAIKKVQIGTTLDMDLPVEMSQFKQKRADSFSEVIGQMKGNKMK